MRKRTLPTALLLGGGFIVAADMRVIAPLLPAVADDFGISIGVAGLTVAFYSLAYAAGQVFYGPLGDRLGKIQVIRVVLLVFAGGTALCSVAPTFPALLVLRVLTGVAAAGVIPMTLAHLGDTIGDYADRQRAIGIFLSAIVSGQIFGQALGGLLAGIFSWQVIFLVLGLIGFGLTAAIWGHSVPTDNHRRAGSRRAFRGIFQTDRPLFLLTFAETFFFLGSFSFAGASLVELHGASYPLVGGLLALFAIGSVAASRVLPNIAANAQEVTRIWIGAVTMAVGFAILATTPSAPLFGVAVLALGLGFTFCHSTLQTRTTEVSPSTRGTAVSLFAGIANVGAASGTLAAGALVDTLGFYAVFAAAALGLLAIAVVAPMALPPRLGNAGTASEPARHGPAVSDPAA